MAGFMDKILVVVEAEKSNREFVRRGYAELLAARANVSVVLNKTRSYLPKWLDTELIASQCAIACEARFAFDYAAISMDYLILRSSTFMLRNKFIIV